MAERKGISEPAASRQLRKDLSQAQGQVESRTELKGKILPHCQVRFPSVVEKVSGSKGIGCHVGCQEVTRCHTRGACHEAHKQGIHLVLKPRTDIPISPITGVPMPSQK